MGFKVLGTMVTFDNNVDVEIENRLARASVTFNAKWDMLGSASASLAKGCISSARPWKPLSSGARDRGT